MKQLLLILISFCWVSIGTAQVNTPPKKKDKTDEPILLDEPEKEKPIRAIAPPPPANGKEEIFKVVEKMPHFKDYDCEGLSGKEQVACGNAAMNRFIAENLKYPKKAYKKQIEGTVVIRFVVAKNGAIKNAEILRSIGGGCEEEALRVVKRFPNWMPGIQRGEAVNVYFNLPIRFKL